MRSRYCFPSHGGHVLVPIDAVRKEAALAWCLEWKHTLATRQAHGELETVVFVPVAEWEQHWLTPEPDEA